MTDVKLERLWHAAHTAPKGYDRADALLEYAEHRPDDPRWRDRLLTELRTPGHGTDVGGFLNCLTVFPGHGAFAVPEVLDLTRHPDALVRGWATEVLMILAHEHPELVNPAEWADVIRERLTDEHPETREDAQSILDGIRPPEPG